MFINLHWDKVFTTLEDPKMEGYKNYPQRISAPIIPWKAINFNGISHVLNTQEFSEAEVESSSYIYSFLYI